MADQINDGFTDIQDRVGDDMENKFDSVEGMIGEVEGKIGEVVDKLDVVEGTVNDMDGKFDGVETFVDNRLVATEEILDTNVHQLKRLMDYRLKDLEKKMDFQIQDIRALSHNGLCRHGWQRVKPVWGMDSEGNRALPLHFPYTVIGFWSLKDAAKSKCETGLLVEDLIDMIGNVLCELLRFYKVRGFEQWPKDLDFQAFQDLAHQALAIELGLSYDAIQANMERKRTLENVEPAATAGPSGNPSQGTKRRRVTSSESADVPRTPSAAVPTQPVARRTRAKRTK